MPVSLLSMHALAAAAVRYAWKYSFRSIGRLMAVRDGNAQSAAERIKSQCIWQQCRRLKRIDRATDT